jgi:hypothetical protein
MLWLPLRSRNWLNSFATATMNTICSVLNTVLSNSGV